MTSQNQPLPPAQPASVPALQEPLGKLDDVAAAINHATAVTHLMGDVFGLIKAEKEPVEKLHTATALLRQTHTTVGSVVFTLQGAPRNTPTFSPTAVSLILEALREDIPLHDPEIDVRSLSDKIIEILNSVSPAALSEVTMRLLQVCDDIVQKLPYTPENRKSVELALDASGSLINAAVSLTAAFHLTKNELPEMSSDRWLEDYSWSVAGQRRDRKALYLPSQEKSDAEPEESSEKGESQQAPALWQRVKAVFSRR